MTGSYFRGDSVPVLLPNDERKFTKVTYNYYEQLNGYSHLKSLGIGYHFYQGKYTNAIMEVLDTDRKTILHIPNVNSGESTKEVRGSQPHSRSDWGGGEARPRNRRASCEADHGWKGAKGGGFGGRRPQVP